MAPLDKRAAVVQVLQLLGMCAKLAPTFDKTEPGEAARRVLDTLRLNIEDLWVWLASNVAVTFQGVTVDASHPGYVIRDDVLVPFYLAQDLPGASELAELVALGRSLRVTARGVICLSGSTALLGTLKFVGDIDYCEYAAAGSYSTDDVVASASAHAGRTALPLCERVKVIEPTWSQSAVLWDSTAGTELKRRIDKEGAYQLKLDFITHTQSVGTAEATNMALLLTAGREDEIVRASFAAQEVLDPGSVLPRPLCDPLQLGRYINFLIEQVEHYAASHPVKALKRALSLARILMLPEWDKRLVTCLEDPRAALKAAIDARTVLAGALSDQTNADTARQETREILRRSLETTIAELKKGLERPSASRPVVQHEVDTWTATSASVLRSFLEDSREAIAAA